ncbi:WecB/TagA/CpsF family glycosyltransferase [Methylobacterium planeticum]|uniref:WecB/TagA/CpsF family glycosyltransferase n=1 Tax=Methylobacterium planeticum TaxID=2615211 RepID=A0A6N6MTL4_9HYPH|nr:WecB/TagA/CpsF family glycosyltransferase [Methylobacterium planeticum]KAB1075208.1 WecB/TagA/CpsF family glycosyltransferase [Methylobacterium planeticum]
MSLSLFGHVFSTGSAAAILAEAEAGPRARPRLVVTANVDHIVVLSENPAFRMAYERAAVRTLDGTPLVWLARLGGRYDAVRVTGHDLLACALAGPQPEDRRVFVVCAGTRVGERIRDLFVQAGLAPDAVAIAVPPFGFEQDATYGRALADAVRAHGTTLLLMGVGAPKSEIWVDRQGAALGEPVVLAVGDAVTVAAGLAPRAPRLVQSVGLEWLFRFLHAPQRLFRRYFVRSWRFVRIVASERDSAAG